MGLANTIRPYASVRGSHMDVLSAPMTAAQTFNKGALVQVVAAGTVTGLDENGSEVLIADLAEAMVGGVAVNGPGAASGVEIPSDFLKNHPDTGDAYATGDRIWFHPWGRGNLFVTNVILATGGAAAETAANITGADRGAAYFITYCSATTPDLGWGVERTAITAGSNTEVYAKVVDVLDDDGNSVTATGVGTQYVFEIVPGLRG